jgi:predicted transcriptional regulator
MRNKYKEKRFEMRMKYKKAFAAKLESRLDKIPTEKLEKVIKVIDSKLKKIESNSKLSATKKERLLSVYEAIKELIEEKLKPTSEGDILESLLK